MRITPRTLEALDELLRDPLYAEVHRKFHHLWTAQVGRDGYDKQAWNELGDAIFRLGVRAKWGEE